MIFSLAITIAMTLQNQCVFAIEIVIMYTMFFGGFLAAFYMPNLTKKSDPPRWRGMTWTMAINFILYALITGHAVWFWTYGCDKHFMNMPCGTANFIFVPVSNDDFRDWRILLGLITFCGAVEFAVLYPLFLILFSQELKRSVEESAIYQGLFPRVCYARIEDQTEQVVDSTIMRIWSKVATWQQKMHRKLGFLRMGLFREPPVLEGRASL
jgi:hypothetical protein